MSNEISRRSFLKASGAAALGLALTPDQALAKAASAPIPPSKDKLKILGVGVGGRGASVLRELETENIIGLCDVDWKYADHVFKRYPDAKKYNDYRVMFDKQLKEADAVMIATADHTHAVIAAQAIAEGKHVFVEKPLTHSVYESRLLTKLAAKHKVATQMGNYGASSEGLRTLCEWVWNGEIGEVRKVEAFTDRPIWPQGLPRPEKDERIPKTMNWDAFIGPAKYRPYNSIYTPWNFRGWWDFGTGALGDMACHILHGAFKSLNLGYPTKVEGSSTLLLSDSCPNAQIVKMTFPARDNMPKVAMPEVEITWYDGGLKPMRPEGLDAGIDLNISGGGVIMYGSKDTLVYGCYADKPYLISGRNPKSPKVLREVTLGHFQDWVRACKEDPAYRTPSASDFSEAGPFNEMVVMGVLAVRLQGLHQVLDWDGENMRFTNIPKNATVRSVIEDGFTIKDGHPTFDKTYTEPEDANAFAAEMVKHTYREGYTLPEMPK